MSSLNPDREMLAQFAGLMFKHARPDAFRFAAPVSRQGQQEGEADQTSNPSGLATRIS